MQFPVLSPQSQESASSTRVIRRRSLTSVHFANFPTKTFCLSPSVASKYILSNKLYSQASFYGKNPEFSEKCSALHFPRCKKVNDPSQFLNVESLNRNYPLNILIKCGFYFQSQSRHSTPDSIVLQIAASKEMDNFASQTLQPLTTLFLNSRQMRVCHQTRQIAKIFCFHAKFFDVIFQGVNPHNYKLRAREQILKAFILRRVFAVFIRLHQ